MILDFFLRLGIPWELIKIAGRMFCSFIWKKNLPPWKIGCLLCFRCKNHNWTLMALLKGSHKNRHCFSMQVKQSSDLQCKIILFKLLQITSPAHRWWNILKCSNWRLLPVKKYNFFAVYLYGDFDNLKFEVALYGVKLNLECTFFKTPLEKTHYFYTLCFAQKEILSVYWEFAKKINFLCFSLFFGFCV